MAEKINIEENLTQQVSDKAALKAKTVDLEGRIAKMLKIAEDASVKAKAEYDKEQAELEKLMAEKSKLEENLTQQSSENEALKAKTVDLEGRIAEMLKIAEEASVKAKAEQDKAKVELEKLMAEKSKIEENLTQQNSEKEALKAKTVDLEGRIAKMLKIAEEGTKKAEVEFTSLLATKTSLESNLTKHITHEKALEDENSEISKLMSEVKGKYEEIQDVLKVETKELLGVMGLKEKLLSEKSALEAKIEELLATTEESNKKAQLEMTALMSDTKSLETENATLKATVEKLKEEKAAVEAKAKEEAEKAAAAEAKAKEEAEKIAAAEEKAKEEAEKAAAAEAKAKEEAEKAAAEAKAKEAETKLMKAFSLTEVAFHTGSARLTTGSKQRLDVAVDTIKNYEGYTYKIQGHTDSIGSDSANLALSAKRAEAVKAYLVSKGIDKNILTAEGFGSSHPIASNDTRQGREKNRRVVFEIVK